MNSFWDNWFISGQVGANVYFSKHDGVRSFKDRFSPAANLYIGKWFTPVFGARVGVDWLPLKGMGENGSLGQLRGEHTTDGFFKTRQIEVGPVFDLMANLTNLFCGYRPDRILVPVVTGHSPSSTRLTVNQTAITTLTTASLPSA